MNCKLTESILKEIDKTHVYKTNWITFTGNAALREKKQEILLPLLSIEMYACTGITKRNFT